MGVFTKLSDGIADLSELNVQTFTGTLTSAVKSNSAGSVLDWTKLINNASQATGKVKLMASSRLKFDGDSDSYFDENISSEMLDAHLTAVDAGQKVREGLISMFKDLLGLSE